MPRELRIQFPGATYRVMNRREAGARRFLYEVARQDFIKTLAQALPENVMNANFYGLTRFPISTNQNCHFSRTDPFAFRDPFAFANLPVGINTLYGWKTASNVLNDVSVHAVWPGAAPTNNSGWTPTGYRPPTGGPFVPLDLAFKLTTPTNCTGPVLIKYYYTNYVVLTWPNGILQAATNVVGPYEDVPGATSPYTNITTSPPYRFFGCGAICLRLHLKFTIMKQCCHPAVAKLGQYYGSFRRGGFFAWIQTDSKAENRTPRFAVETGASRVQTISNGLFKESLRRPRAAACLQREP